MKRKDDFHFDFNEDAEPVAELHRLRMAMTKHFKTNQEHWDYIWSTPPIEELIAEVKAEIAQKNAEAARKEAKAAKRKAAPSASRKATSKKKTPARRKREAVS